MGATSSKPSKPSLAGPWTLQYFPIPGAPGEIVRLLLMLSGVEWTDERVPGKDWGALKPTTKFGCMPILTHADGRSLGQSRALARFLAKGVTLEGALLYPDDAVLALAIDEIIDAAEDVRMLVAPTFAIQDQAEKEAARAALFATDGSGKLFEGFKRLEALAGGGGHVVGGVFTLADCWFFVTINQFRAGFIDGVPVEGWLEQLPKLKAVVETMTAVPAVKSYYAKQAEENQKYAIFVAGQEPRRLE